MNSREATIALNMLPKIGPVRVKKLIQHLGSAEAILSAPIDSLLKVDGLGPKLAETLISWEDTIDLQREITEAEERGITILTQQDPNYPSPLLNTYDPPLVLYVWGELKNIDNHGIAMVGSRKHSHYGQQTARQLAFQLANAGITILSGLARGIDTHSHEGALAAKGRTIAVIGSGLAQLYPPENLPLAENIASGNGAVVSEFPLHKKPDKKSFPMRNRIVAGWSDGVLVVECPKWSGSLITANMANDMGRPVYAIPGSIHSPTSAGCNELIRNGATLVSCADDILQDRELLPLFDQESSQQLPVNPALLSLNPTEQTIYDTIGDEPLILDDIVDKTQLSLPEISITLLQLEIKKLLQQLPGQRYVRKSF